MINQQLINFIRQQLHVGSTKEKITKDLLSGGWNEQDIKEGFETIVDIPIQETPIEKQTINPPFDKNLNQVQFQTETINKIVTPPNIIVSNQLEGLTSVSIPVAKIDSTIEKSELKSASKPESIIELNQKLNPSLHFNPNATPDLDFSKDSSSSIKNTKDSTNVLNKAHIKIHFNKKIFFITLILLLLIAVLISIYYFKDSLKDLPFINYFNK